MINNLKVIKKVAFIINRVYIITNRELKIPFREVNNMCNPSQYINVICSECNPRTYDLTLANFVGQENIVEMVGDPDGSFIEYLYECCECSERVWIDEQWVKRNSVK